MDVDFVGVALSWLGTICIGGFETVAGFFLMFCPEADPEIMAAIGSWGQISADGLTFNLLYFMDMQVIALFLGGTVVVLFFGLILAVVRETISLVHKILDSIPIIG